MFSSSPDYVIDVAGATPPCRLVIGNWIIDATTFLSTARSDKNEVNINREKTSYHFKHGIVVVIKGKAVKNGTFQKKKRNGELVIAEGLTLILPR